MGDYVDREHQRFVVDAFADVSTEQSDDVLLFNEIENISMGGMAFSVAESIEVGGKVNVTINFPETGERIDVTCKTMWRRDSTPPVIGVKFIELSPADLDVLKRYMKRMKEREARMKKNFHPLA